MISNTVRMTAAALAISVAAMAGACTSTGALDPTVIAADCKTACAFAPTVGSIAALLSADPAIATAEAAVKMICSSFSAQHKLGGGAVVKGAAVSVDVTLPNGKTVQVIGSIQ